MLPSSHLDFFEKYDSIIRTRKLNLKLYHDDYNSYPNHAIFHDVNGHVNIVKLNKRKKVLSEDINDFIIKEMEIDLKTLLMSTTSHIKSLKRHEEKMEYCLDVVSKLITYFTIVESYKVEDDYSRIFKYLFKTTIQAFLGRFKQYMGDQYFVFKNLMSEKEKIKDSETNAIKLSITVDEFALLLSLLYKAKVIKNEPFNQLTDLYNVVSKSFETPKSKQEGMSRDNFRNHFASAMGWKINDKYVESLKGILLRMLDDLRRQPKYQG